MERRVKTLIKTGLAVVALSLCLGGNAVAGSGDDAYAAAQRGDYATAYRLWLPLAEQGSKSAQFNLGQMYNMGQGVMQDHANAVKWYRKAAEQGVASAQINLGVMYTNGQGVPQDYVQAHKWFNLAAANEPKKKLREKAAKSRDWVSEKMTSEQIAEAQKLAREWKPTNSTQGK
jgi:hypothetical protein